MVITQIGHNLGLKHDRGQWNECTDYNHYEYGWCQPEAKFRTIMALNCIKGQCDNNKGGGCTRIQRFSNPSILYYDGNPLGDPGSNSARAINDVRVAVAGYHPHLFSGALMPSAVPTMVPSQACDFKSVQIIRLADPFDNKNGLIVELLFTDTMNCKNVEITEPMSLLFNAPSSTRIKPL